MKKVLHVGCGVKNPAKLPKKFHDPEWQEIRFDIDPNVLPDITGTITDMNAVENESVDAVYSSHNIEHLYPHEVPLALKEFLRALKNNGFAIITCPDLQSVCELVANDKLLEPAYISPAGPISPIDILYGHRPSLARGNLFMAHRCGFTLKALANTLIQVGFKKVYGLRDKKSFALWALAFNWEPDDDTVKIFVNDFLNINHT